VAYFLFARVIVALALMLSGIWLNMAYDHHPVRFDLYCPGKRKYNGA
jgi:hypothetical protein